MAQHHTHSTVTRRRITSYPLNFTDNLSPTMRNLSALLTTAGLIIALAVMSQPAKSCGDIPLPICGSSLDVNVPECRVPDSNH